jgi:uncharacterized repeat protein (TIGR01451 family)
MSPGFAATSQSPAARRPAAARFDSPAGASSLFSSLPAVFEPNLGQANLQPADPRAQYFARGPGYSLLLGSEGAILSLRFRSSGRGPAKTASNRAADTEAFEFLRMKLAGANRNARPSATDPLPGKTNYLLGNDPAKWRRNVPQFARVRYANIYPGIDLVFYGTQRRLEYDFEVAPRADPAQAEMEFDGAERLELNDGVLVIKCRAGDVRLGALRVYQQIAGRQQEVEGRFVLRGANRASFAIGPYDHSRELVIDPVPGFSSYFGGTGDEHATSVALDGSGNIYLVGSTNSPTLPAGASTTVFQSSLAGVRNVYIAKINPAANPVALDYVTYLGGNQTDTPVGIGVDGAGDPFVAGTTTSTNFPTTATAYQPVPETGTTTPTPHGFVSELDPTASSLKYSTYLSGNGTDNATGMAVDGSGNVYITGTTTSTDVGSPTGSQFPSSSLPYALPFQSTPVGSPQFFVSKVNTFNAGKGSIAYSTYFGGGISQTTPPVAIGAGIAVDANGNIYFDGTTNFTYTNGEVGDFPILNAYQPCLDQPPPTVVTNPPTCTNSSTTAPDAFLAKINPNAAQGAQLQWSSYFGGSANDSAMGIALDSGAANVYIVGTTNSPTITALTSFAAFQRCLDTPVNPAAGAACPTIASPAPNDAFVARLTNPTQTSTTNPINMGLTYFSYLGGSGAEAGQAITVDTANGGLVTGWTQSRDFPVFPVPSDIQGNLTGTQDAFVARLNTAAANGQNTTGSWATYFGGTNTSTAGVLATTQGTGIALDVNQNTYFAGDTNAIDLQVSGLKTTNAGGFDAFVTQLKTAASLDIVGVLTLGTNQTYISAGNQATFTYTLTNNGPDPATNITVTDNINPIVTSVPVTYNSASATSGTCSGSSTTTSIVCAIPSLQSGSTATITIVLTPSALPGGGTKGFNGGAVQVTGPNNIVLASTQVSAQMSDFTLKVSPPSASVNLAGETAVYQAQLFPQPVYGAGITLSCTGLPPGSACAFTTPTVTLQGTSPGATTLNVTTTARPITTGSLKSRLGRFYAVWLAVPGFALLGVVDRRRRRAFGFLTLCTLFTMLFLLPACGRTNTQPPVSGTPAGTYPITVSATSGSDVKSQGIQLVVP